MKAFDVEMYFEGITRRVKSRVPAFYLTIKLFNEVTLGKFQENFYKGMEFCLNGLWLTDYDFLLRVARHRKEAP